MRVGKFLMAAAVASMTVAPAFAAPAPAGSLSSATSVRAAGPSVKKSKDSDTGLIVGVLAAAAVGLGIWAALDHNDSKPNSP